MEIFWSRWWGLNPRPLLYESTALPLSYIGFKSRPSGLSYIVVRRQNDNKRAKKGKDPGVGLAWARS